MFKPRLISLLTVASFVLGTQCIAMAQTKFLANFDNNGQVNQGQLGPSNLINQGWTFRVQTGPNPLQGSWTASRISSPQCKDRATSLPMYFYKRRLNMHRG